MIRAIPLLIVLTAACLATRGFTAWAAPNNINHISRSAPPDSARTVAAARSAQARFERIRRNRLPWTNDSGGGDCDERVGRFCLTHGDDDEDWTALPEPDEVREARETLIARLDSAAARIPGDTWIAGQRVRYLVEAGRAREAVAAAEQCRAPAGWPCAAYRGFALHAAGEFPQADSAFATALREMPERERRRWTDLSPLLTGGGWGAYRRADGAERDSLERRFWWLADPLYLEPGNERRTEHFSRWVLDLLQDRARSTEGISWGGDLRELLLRYGWPAGWERVRPRRLGAELSLVSHYPPRGREFIPSSHFVADPLGIGSEDWELDFPEARTEYLPGYAFSFQPLEHQLAVFRRGDSVTVVAAYDLGRDSTAADRPIEAALFLASSERDTPRVAWVKGGRITGALQLTAPPLPALLSVEARADSGVAARARYGLRLSPLESGAVAISDLLLITGAEPLPAALPDAVPRARGSTRVKTDEQLGLFWEVYGLRPDQPIRVDIALTSTDRGWLRRLGERAGLLDAPAPVRLQWEERAPADGSLLARSIAIRLPDLSPGSYLLEVSVTPVGGESRAASREILVER